MPGSVAVPEKTLEHWSSQYIQAIYRTKAGLWWPATGQDIDFRGLPARPGKAVQLELKTLTIAGTSVYEVHVDLGQLWEYVHKPRGHQPFYAFPHPRPGWDGFLHDVAATEGQPATEAGFSRSGRGLWFAKWMVVLPPTVVASVLGQELTQHGSRDRGTRRLLVRFDRGKASWGSGASDPEVIAWRDFWPQIERCGRPGWPQLIRLPARILRIRNPYSPEQVLALLRTASEEGEAAYQEEQLVTLEPASDGYYQIPAAPGTLSTTKTAGSCPWSTQPPTSSPRASSAERGQLCAFPGHEPGHHATPARTMAGSCPRSAKRHPSTGSPSSQSEAKP
jgi:hypothetical protein